MLTGALKRRTGDSVRRFTGALAPFGEELLCFPLPVFLLVVIGL